MPLEERLAGIKAIVDGLGSWPVPGFPNRSPRKGGGL